MTWRQMIGVGVRRVVLARGELDELEGPKYAARRAELRRKARVRPGRQVRSVYSSPRRLPSMRSSGLPAIGNPRAMPLHLTLEGVVTPVRPLGVRPSGQSGLLDPEVACSPHRRPGMGATLSTGGLVSTRGLASYELAVWVVLFMDTGPRDTRAGRLQGSPTTTLTRLPGPTTEVKRHSARRHNSTTGHNI